MLTGRAKSLHTSALMCEWLSRMWPCKYVSALGTSAKLLEHKPKSPVVLLTRARAISAARNVERNHNKHLFILADSRWSTNSLRPGTGDSGGDRERDTQLTRSGAAINKVVV